MKTLTIFLGFLGIIGLISTSERIDSKVYSFSGTKTERTGTGEKRQLMEGETRHFENFEIHTIMLEPGKTSDESNIHKVSEEIIFVREGKLKISVNAESKVVGSGSVALIMPGDNYELENPGTANTTFYVISYKSKQPINEERGKIAGGSQILDFDAIEFTPHDKGGIRRYFDRKSAMSDRLEMHATNLNAGIKSHEPHTHHAAEIILMIDGNTEMEIGDSVYKANKGDVYFVASDVPHAIKNIGDKQCMYFAYQWE